MTAKEIVLTKVAWAFPTQSVPNDKIAVGLYVRCPLSLSDFNRNCNVSTIFSDAPIYNLMKVRSAILDLIPADRLTDRQTDMAKLIGIFLQL
jgi:hypothetical protein